MLALAAGALIFAFLLSNFILLEYIKIWLNMKLLNVWCYFY